ncbi:MAG TPA: 2Fe-2S iron-sulfur cluster-binding protein, partial [Spirochaetia bacterium]|nr:2Fe-2S iron-sulfur cluster-binding protein [Spirochaetia bacterium]
MMERTDCGGEDRVSITISHEGRTESISATKNANLLDVINSLDGLSFDAPCGGKGTCGKCRVRIVKGETDPVKERERKFLKEA